MALQLYRTEKKITTIEAHRPSLSKMELESVLDCLINDQLGPGIVTQKFEKIFAGTFKYKHVLAVNSLAAAYHMAFLALELKPGERVLMSALSPVQAYDAVRYVGAEPVLVDVAQNSFHPDPAVVQARFEEQGEEKPTVLVLDHTYGSRSPLDPNFFKDMGVKIVEDFTGLVGSDVEGEFFGNAGHIAVCGLSEHDLVTTGNGAVTVTSNNNLFKRLTNLLYGAKREPGSVAYDCRLGDFQAALGIDQLSRLGVTIQRRKKIGQKYLETLRATKHETYFKEPGIDAYLQFPVIINRNQDEVRRYFNSLQIGVTRATENPLHHLMDLPKMEFANAERIFRKALSIPAYPSLTANNVERIASSLRGLL